MRFSRYLQRGEKDKGATIVLVSILLVVIVGIAALAIDVGNLVAAKSELQKLADGAALAAAGDLGHQYLTTTCGELSFTAISEIADEVAGLNKAATKSIGLQASDITVGCWDLINNDFDAFNTADCNCSQRIPNAVKVIARRDSEANTPVDNFFAGVLGPDTVGLKASAIASLSGPSEASGLPIPVGIAHAWYDPARWAAEEKEFCDQPIKLYPTGSLDGCAGWHVFTEQPSSVPKLRDWLACLTLPEDDPDYCAPSGDVGDIFDYTGGTLATVFPDMKALYDAKKDPDTGEWQVTVPVYGWDNCDNPNEDIPTVGFSTIIITEVVEAPEKIIQAKVLCDEFVAGHGGGGPYGTLGTIPDLVE